MRSNSAPTSASSGRPVRPENDPASGPNSRIRRALGESVQATATMRRDPSCRRAEGSCWLTLCVRMRLKCHDYGTSHIPKVWVFRSQVLAAEEDQPWKTDLGPSRQLIASITASWQGNSVKLRTNVAFSKPGKRYWTLLHGTRGEPITSIREAQPRVPPAGAARPARRYPGRPDRHCGRLQGRPADARRSPILRGWWRSSTHRVRRREGFGAFGPKRNSKFRGR
jgi:hypothetical protein